MLPRRSRARAGVRQGSREAAAATDSANAALRPAVPGVSLRAATLGVKSAKSVEPAERPARARALSARRDGLSRVSWRQRRFWFAGGTCEALASPRTRTPRPAGGTTEPLQGSPCSRGSCSTAGCHRGAAATQGPAKSSGCYSDTKLNAWSDFCCLPRDRIFSPFQALSCFIYIIYVYKIYICIFKPLYICICTKKTNNVTQRHKKSV